MRYNKCPECGKPVKEGASRCRHCRAKQQTDNATDTPAENTTPGGWSRWKRDILILLLPFALVGVPLVVGLTIESKKSEERWQQNQRSDAERRAEAGRIRTEHNAVQLAEQKRQEELAQERAQRRAERVAECKADWECWANRHLLRATVACQPLIQQQAQYDYRWTDGWLEPKFSHIRQTGSAGVFVYSGDKLQLQNGFGAWQNHVYHCRYNIEAEKVEFAKVNPGRL